MEIAKQWKLRSNGHLIYLYKMYTQPNWNHYYRYDMSTLTFTNHLVIKQRLGKMLNIYRHKMIGAG